MSYSINGSDIYLLVGIETREQRHLNTANSDHSIKVSAIMEHKQEDDELNKLMDSIYFIEFKIDKKFLDFLSDSEMTTPKNLTANLPSLTRNRNFVTLVRNELKVRRLSRVEAY